MKSLTALNILNVSNNGNITGNFPGEILTSMVELKVLDAYNNNFTGPLSPEIPGLEKLKHFSLDRNFFSGEIPEIFRVWNILDSTELDSPAILQGFCLGGLTKLEILDMASCTLTGEIPKKLDVSFNITFVVQTSDLVEEDGASVAVEESFEPETNLWDGEMVEEDGGDIPGPQEEAKLFVGNLPYDVDSQALAMLFEQAGTVEISEVIYNRDTDQSRGFGFVTMSNVDEAEKAVEKFNRELK